MVLKFLKYPATGFSFSHTADLLHSGPDVINLSFGNISGASAATMENVAIFDSPGKGRGLKATKEFWAGDVIFSELSLAAVVFDRYSIDGKLWLWMLSYGRCVQMWSVSLSDFPAVGK